MTPLSPVIDHVVVDVRDRIDEAMHCFASLGFLLTPRGRHTLGSVNHLAMFESGYLELLGFGEDAQPARSSKLFQSALTVWYSRPWMPNRSIDRWNWRDFQSSRCNPSPARSRSMV